MFCTRIFLLELFLDKFKMSPVGLEGILRCCDVTSEPVMDKSKQTVLLTYILFQFKQQMRNIFQFTNVEYQAIQQAEPYLLR